MSARSSLLIRGALVFDGTGAPPTHEDVAIRDGRIVARGPALDVSQAGRVVDARGLWLMPGLLDIHTHLDLEVELAPGLPESVRHGTATVVEGNCSLGTAFGSQRRNGDDPILDCFARVENIPKSVLRKVVDRMDWHTTAGYLADLHLLPLFLRRLDLRYRLHPLAPCLGRLGPLPRPVTLAGARQDIDSGGRRPP